MIAKYDPETSHIQIWLEMYCYSYSMATFTKETKFLVQDKAIFSPIFLETCPINYKFIQCMQKRGIQGLKQNLVVAP
jgi:hypothetical protein